MYNPGCCGKTLLPERVQWCRLRRTATFVWEPISAPNVFLSFNQAFSPSCLFLTR
jgi:hypothetical protein